MEQDIPVPQWVQDSWRKCAEICRRRAAELAADARSPKSARRAAAALAEGMDRLLRDADPADVCQFCQQLHNAWLVWSIEPPTKGRQGR